MRNLTPEYREAVADLTAKGWPTKRIALILPVKARTIREWRAEMRAAEEAERQAEADRRFAEATRNLIASSVGKSLFNAPRSASR